MKTFTAFSLIFAIVTLFFGAKGFNHSIKQYEYEMNMKNWVIDIPEITAKVVDTASMVQLDANRYRSTLAFQYNLRIMFENGREVTEIFTDPFEYKKHPIGSDYVIKITEGNYKHYGLVPPYTNPGINTSYALAFIFMIITAICLFFSILEY
jgi:hypothetical protein